jgi:hypothetical protein
MATIAFPPQVPATIRWGLSRNIVRQVSPFSRRLKRIGLTGDLWVCNFSIPPLTGTPARVFRSFLARVSAHDMAFTARDFSYVRAGTGGNSATIAGADQSGATLALGNLEVSQDVAVAAGDRILLNTGQVVESAADTPSNGSGAASVPLIMAMRASPTNSAPVEMDAPVVTFALDEDTVDWLVNQPLHHRFEFSATELI